MWWMDSARNALLSMDDKGRVRATDSPLLILNYIEKQYRIESDLRDTIRWYRDNYEAACKQFTALANKYNGLCDAALKCVNSTSKIINDPVPIKSANHIIEPIKSEMNQSITWVDLWIIIGAIVGSAIFAWGCHKIIYRKNN